MVGALYFVYVARTSQEDDPPFVGVSHYPPLDLAVLAQEGYERLTVLKGPLPIGLAELEALRAVGRTRTRHTAVLARPGRAWAGATAPVVAELSPRPHPALAASGPAIGAQRWFASCLRSVLHHLGFVGVATRASSLAARRRPAPDGGSGGDRLRSGAAAFAGPATLTARDHSSVEIPSQEDLRAVSEVLEGRILFDREIGRALEERGHPIPRPLEDVLQVLVLRGIVARVPSVAVDRFGIATCERCGGRDIVEASCASCGSDECLRCLECASMGEARSCRPLYYAPRRFDPLPQRPESRGWQSRQEDSGDPEVRTLVGDEARGWEVTLPFGLTKAQRDASRFLESFVSEDERSECLVHAVCGAGKTEVCFGAVALALRHGGRVLFAVPRSDVVAEVAPRVSAAVPDARVVALRGASRERYLDADIVVATTHQVLRFYQAFDLVILDEADAFPFRGSRMLRYAMRRATAPTGKTVYMTATPDESLLAAADRGEVALTRISARHHGHPLPVPAIVTVSFPSVDERGALSTLSRPGSTPGCPRASELPFEVTAIIRASLRAGHRVFVFVPTVDLTEQVCAALRVSLASSACSVSSDRVPLVARPRVAFVHSRHPERDQLREAFKEGRIDVLVTTTIMERGINVPMADVVVLYADFDRVFDSSTLVQMAGRAGRSREYPRARVYFVAARTSPAMRAAVASIRAMNRHAADSGYLVTVTDPDGASVSLERKPRVGR
ncbi:MAG: helicase-related protein [Betaproteobacteria bacterium]